MEYSWYWENWNERNREIFVSYQLTNLAILSKYFHSTISGTNFSGRYTKILHSTSQSYNQIVKILFISPYHLCLRLPIGLFLSGFMNISHFFMSPSILNIKPTSRFFIFMILIVRFLSVTRNVEITVRNEFCSSSKSHSGNSETPDFSLKNTHQWFF
jgi:hypothetical protein